MIVVSERFERQCRTVTMDYEISITSSACRLELSVFHVQNQDILHADLLWHADCITNCSFSARGRWPFPHRADFGINTGFPYNGLKGLRGLVVISIYISLLEVSCPSNNICTFTSLLCILLLLAMRNAEDQSRRIIKNLWKFVLQYLKVVQL